jgi:hypothetical protein
MAAPVDPATISQFNGYGPIANRAHQMNQANAGGGDVNSLVQHTRFAFPVITDVTGDVVLFFENRNGGGTASPNRITVRASIEVTPGTILLGYAPGGGRDVVIEPGGFATIRASLQGAKITKGSKLFVRTQVAIAAMGLVWPTAHQAGWDATEGTVTGSTTDLTASGTITANTSGGYGPTAILGNRRGVGTLVVTGDSIIAGVQDSPSDLGFMDRWAQTKNISMARFGSPGMRASSPVVARELFIGATRSLCEFGVNDLANAQPLATVQASLIAQWKAHYNETGRVYQTTITPETTSTDGWATTTNQTKASWDSVRVSLNAWIRAGGPVDGSGNPAAIGSGTPFLTGVIDLADQVESARDSGIWKAGWTSDGIHPNVTGNTNIATSGVLSPLLS